ncbi:hypothetical protein GCM10010272_66900 [Streptomyces lateritius]|nr:hypothetical protein GCM10010272_66900 [Streptomyces lateritius]
MSATGQRRRDPQQVARRIGYDLHVHTVAAVLLREVGPAVADAVALGEGPVEQDVIRIRLAQDPQEPGRPSGQMLDDSCDVGVPTDMPKPAAICVSVSCRRR